MRKEYCDSSKFMRLNVRALQIVGLWPKINLPKKYGWLKNVYRLYGWLFLLIVMLNVATQIADVVVTWGDLENLAANGSVTLIYVAAFLKQSNFFIQQKRFSYLVENIQTGYFSQSLSWNAERNKIANKANKFSTTISWIYYAVTFGTTASFTVSALLNSYPQVFGIETELPRNETVKSLPMKAAYPFDIQNAGFFAVAFLFQCIMLSLAPLMNAGIDVFVTSLIIHCCAQFDVLKHALRSIKERTHDEIPDYSQTAEEKEKKRGTAILNCFITALLATCIAVFLHEVSGTRTPHSAVADPREYVRCQPSIMMNLGSY